jgi:hypothetical protein
MTEDRAARSPGRAGAGPTPEALGGFAVNLASFLVVVALIVAWPAPLWHDEHWYLQSVEALGRQGLGASFLRGLPGPAGPLYAVVHAACAPLTGLRPVGVRLVNAVLFLLTALALAATLRLRRVAFPVVRASHLMAAPVLYGALGTALTEVPAMLFFYAHLPLLLVAVARARSGRPGGIGLAVVAGLVCGVSILGRQQFLAALAAAPVLALGSTRTWPVLVAYAAAAVALPAVVFAIWGGIVPPGTAWVGGGVSPRNGALALSYAGVVYALYDVRGIVRHRVEFALIVVGAMAVNLALGLVTLIPMKTLAELCLPAWAVPAYARAACGAMLGFGAAFLAHLGRLAAARKGDSDYLYLCAALVLILSTCLKVTHMFSGRYVAPVVPLLVLVAAEGTADSYGKVARMALGCLVGLLVLATYFYNADRFGQ